MKDQELDAILKSAVVPARVEEYWEQFPGRVLGKARWGAHAAGTAALGHQPAARFPLMRLAGLAAGLAAVCILVGFGLGFWRGRNSAEIERQQVSTLAKCFAEMQALFPNQVQAVVFDEAGAHLALADKASVPQSQPLYIKIHSPSGCLRAVTFSGQRIQVDGHTWEVLLSRQGEVLLLSRQWAWSSSKTVAATGPYQIEARPLGAT